MLLQLQVGDDRYVLDAHGVAEIIPMVGLQHFPHAPQCVAGLVNYRGAPVPVVDFCRLAGGRPAAAALSSRIVVLRYPIADGDAGLLGLLAEGATRLIRHDELAFVDGGLRVADAGYLGRVAGDADGLIYEIRVERLLPDDVKAELFCRRAQAGAPAL